jgi:hypothetical protein
MHKLDARVRGHERRWGGLRQTTEPDEMSAFCFVLRSE